MNFIRSLAWIVTVSLSTTYCAQSKESKHSDEIVPTGKIKVRVETTNEYWNGRDFLHPRLFKIDTVFFDTAGNETESITSFGDINTVSHIVCKRDAKGLLIERSGVGSNHFRNIYSYDSLGNNIMWRMYDSRDSLKSIIRNTYNSKNLCIEEEGLNRDGTFRFKATTKYDSTGNVIEVDSYNSDGSLKNKIISTFDDNANEIERDEFNPDGSLIESQKWAYDEKGNMTEMISQRPGCKETKTTIILEYDDHNNWIKQTQMSDGNIYSITERKIIYY